MNPFHVLTAARESIEKQIAEIEWPDGTGSGIAGLTPDAIRLSPEYRAALNLRNDLWESLRSVNAEIVREYPDQNREYLRQKREAKRQLSRNA